MKTRINFFSISATLAIVSLMLFSCAKEELSPVTASNKAISQPVLNQKIPGTDMTFAEAFERIDPDPHPDWDVAIKSYTCFREGETLLVYNPNNPSLDFYDSGRFSIYWFKDGKPVRDNKIRLECVCRGRYAVVVLNKATKQGVGIAFHTVRTCYADDVILPATDN